jgi:N-acetylglucosaminyldiphosphoundecaprenol N-acetyl-beta-D-mannosaminyltransferase
MRILNINNLNTGDLKDILLFCQKRILKKEGAFLIPMNPIKAIKARKNSEFQKIIDKADWVFPDAWGLKWAAHFLYEKKISLLPGHKVMISLLAQAEENGQSVYILGTTNSVLHEAAIELTRLFPELKISGFHDGFFSKSDEDRVFRHIASFKPQYVFVAMGEYKQERVIQKLRVIYPEAIFMGVGGSIDLVAKKQPSPPEWIRMHHLEWLFRLYRQPFRLPRFRALPYFTLLTIIEKMKLTVS